MKIDKIITTVNENETYLNFLPLMSAAWQKIAGLKPVIGFITDRDEDDPLVQKAMEYGEIHLFEPLYGINQGVQAKVTRLFLASEDASKDENRMIVDVDMIPLTSEVIKVFDEAPEDRLVKWGYDHRAFAPGTPDHGKWPMDRTTATAKIFKEIINPNNLGYEELLRSWMNFRVVDGREDITLPFDRFSDESLLRTLYERWEDKETKTHLIPRTRLEKELMSRRLDRVHMHNWKNLKDRLNEGEFIEVHGLRPLNNYLSFYEDIFNFFGIDKEEAQI